MLLGRRRTRVLCVFAVQESYLCVAPNVMNRLLSGIHLAISRAITLVMDDRFMRTGDGFRTANRSED